jgi:hypothetical protein
MECEGLDFTELVIFCEDSNKTSGALQQEILHQLSNYQR